MCRCRMHSSLAVDKLLVCCLLSEAVYDIKLIYYYKDCGFICVSETAQLDHLLHCTVYCKSETVGPILWGPVLS